MLVPPEPSTSFSLLMVRTVSIRGVSGGSGHDNLISGSFSGAAHPPKTTMAMAKAAAQRREVNRTAETEGEKSVEGVKGLMMVQEARVELLNNVVSTDACV